MVNPLRLIDEIDACDGREQELTPILEALISSCGAESAWYLMYDSVTKREVTYLPILFPEVAWTWVTEEGKHPWNLWTDFASSLPAGDLMETGRFDRSEAMHHMGEMFKQYDCVQTVGFSLPIAGRQHTALGLFRADKRGPFDSAATRFVSVILDAMERFSRRNWTRRNFVNPFDPEGISLQMFSLRLAEHGVDLAPRVVETLWLFYLGLSDGEIIVKMKPTGRGTNVSRRYVISNIDEGRACLRAPSRVMLMKYLTALIVSPIPRFRR